jgi:hypothetical protein
MKGGSMARPLRREIDRTFRCLDEDLLFTAKMEYLGHDEGVGSHVVKWVPNRAWGITCPNDPFHRIEFVEE